MKQDYQRLDLSHMNIERKLGNSFINIQPGALCAFDRNTPSNSRHYHNCYELCMVTDGGGGFLMGEERLEIKKGDIFIADPQLVHEIAVEPEKDSDPFLQIYYFSVSLHDSDLSAEDSQEEKCIKRFLKGHRRVCAVQGRMMVHLDSFCAYARLKNHVPFILESMVVSAVLDGLSALTRMRPGGAAKLQAPSSRIDEALLYIARHINEKITLEQIAQAASTSKRNIQLLFRQHLNSTVTDYINCRRMSVASSYLRMNFRVRDVAVKVGIEDPAQFCRVFKKYFGMTPKDYQTAYAADGMTFAADIG